MFSVFFIVKALDDLTLIRQSHDKRVYEFDDNKHYKECDYCHLAVKLKRFQHRSSNEVIDRLTPKR